MMQQKPDWQTRVLADFGRLLAPRLRTIGYALFRLDENGDPFEGKDSWERQEERRQKAFIEFLALSAEETDRFWQILCPQLFSAISLLWQADLPTDTPYTRYFRSADDHWSNRQSWFENALNTLFPLEQDILTLASSITQYWVATVSAPLLATVVVRGLPEAEQVWQTLLRVAHGDSADFPFSPHAIYTLLQINRPEGWELCGRLLRSAQRQEGLRGLVLSASEGACLGAFCHILTVLETEKMTRFVGVATQLNSWFNTQTDPSDEKTSAHQLHLFLTALQSAEQRQACYQGDSAEAVYFALLAQATEEISALLPILSTLLDHPDPAMRLAAAHFLFHTQYQPARPLWERCLVDPDLRIASLAVRQQQWNHYNDKATPPIHTLYEQAIPRFPTKAPVVQPLIWAWEFPITTQNDCIAAWWVTRGNRPISDFFPHFGLLNSSQRQEIAGIIGAQQQFSAEDRTILLQIAGDTQSYTREVACQALRKTPIDRQSAKVLESYLHRKDAQLRRTLITMLLDQPDQEVFASAERLLAAKSERERQAGLELLNQMKEAGREIAQCESTADLYGQRAKKLSSAEKLLLDQLHPDRITETLSALDGFGLFDPAQCTPRIPPRQLPLPSDQHVLELLYSLDQFIELHADLQLRIPSWQDPEGDLVSLKDAPLWQMPYVDQTLPRTEKQKKFPLFELMNDWWTAQPAEWRGDGNFALLQLWALAQCYGNFSDEDREAAKKSAEELSYGPLPPVQPLKHGGLIATLTLQWLWQLFPIEGVIGRLIDLAEYALTIKMRHPYQSFSPSIWMQIAEQLRQLQPEAWTTEELLRWWQLLHWADRPTPQHHRQWLQFNLLLHAYLHGAANRNDLFDYLFGECGCSLCLGLVNDEKGEFAWDRSLANRPNYYTLATLSMRKPNDNLIPHANHPDLQEIVDQIRQRVLPIELKRGDLATPASQIVSALRYTGGLERLVQTVWAMGKDEFVRGWQSDGVSRSVVFSHIVRATYPAPEETPEKFVEAVKIRPISIQRLVEVALYAPQWATHIEMALGWPQFASAVWWMHAHTKDKQWQISEELREAWRAEIALRTPLTGEQLLDGGVDINWFKTVYAELGAERWRYLDNAAKYTSGGGGHARAQLFATAMLGQLDEPTLTQRIFDKRFQDGVRAFGLLPLPKENREEVLLRRYLVLQRFIAESRQFGAQRKASEKLAAEIGMENLSRTADYPDPLRLQWAMEYHAVADLADGFIELVEGEVTIRLAINSLGEPQLTIQKGKRELKTLPPAVKKQPAVVELIERQKEIRLQLKRMRRSLEEAMVRGDLFTVAELRQLSNHPVLKPLLGALVFVNNEGKLGYLGDSAESLLWHNQRDTLRIAHPYDIYQTGEWDQWQRECFNAQRVQPFRQLFRELYIVTPAERETATYSLRYAGQQINGSQGIALLGQTGWVADYNSGIHRTFHREGLTAWLDCSDGLYFGTTLMTLDRVGFSKRGEWQRLRLDQLPPRLFSETMRSLDLVVSVAHAGGVDPESSASTMEMRAMLVQKSAELLKLSNVSFDGNRVLVDGTISKYSIHLNSGVVHQRPGGYVCIVPVQAQQRGRIFLPFVDDDPKSAEILSKVILLARDQQIKDPTILEQIRPKV